MSRSELVAAIDFGSHKIRVAIAERWETELSLIGFAERDSAGVESGVVSNLKELYECTREVFEEAMRGVNGRPRYLVSGLAANMVSYKHSWGMVPLWDRRIKESDRMKTVSIAAAVALSPVQDVAHYLVLDFFIDEMHRIKNPVGMKGVKLGAECLVVIANKTELEALTKCLNWLKMDWCGFVFEPMAAANVVLSPEEMEQGCILIDLGATQSGFVVYQESLPEALAVAAIGGQDVSRQIARELNIPPFEAERIKKGLPDLYIPNPDDTVELELFGGIRGIPWQIVAHIVREQYEDIFNCIVEAAERQGVRTEMLSSAVLVGGGANLPSIEKLAQRHLGCPVRVARPEGPGPQGLLATGSEYSTVLELLYWPVTCGLEGLRVRNGLKGRLNKIRSKLAGIKLQRRR